MNSFEIELKGSLEKELSVKILIIQIMVCLTHEQIGASIERGTPVAKIPVKLLKG